MYGYGVTMERHAVAIFIGILLRDCFFPRGFCKLLLGLSILEMMGS